MDSATVDVAVAAVGRAIVEMLVVSMVAVVMDMNMVVVVFG